MDCSSTTLTILDTNADETHYKVGLLQADGLHGELESGTNQGDDGDPYPG